MYDELVKRLREASNVKYGKRVNVDRELLTQAADAIEECVGKTDTFKWIPLTERLPEENAPCIVYNKYYGPMVGWRIDGERFRIPGSRFPDHPTHWMPLAKLPKEE